MAQMTISGLSEATYRGWKELAAKYDVSIATLVRPVLREGLADAEENDIPTWVGKEIDWEQLLNQNRWRMRVTYFESRVREHFEDATDKSPMPPPERLEWSFVDSCKEEVITQAPERWRDEMAEFLENEMERYRAIYHGENPGTGPNPRNPEEVVEYAARRVKHDRIDQAVEYAEALDQAGHLPRDIDAKDIVERARYKVNQKEWDETMSPDKRHTHDRA